MSKSRPTYTDPTQWATDEDYSAPGQAWNGEPTKVDPGSARRAIGYEPSQRPPAEWINYQLRACGEWATYQDAIEVLNWERPPGTFPTSFRLMSLLATDYAGGEGVLWAVGYHTGTNASVIYRSYDGGYTWETAETLPGSSNTAFDADTSGSVILAVSNTTARILRMASGAAWTAANIGSMSAFYCVTWDPYREKFWCGGYNTSQANPRVVELPTAGTLASAIVRTLTGSANSKCPKAIACGPRAIVAVPLDEAGPDYWTSTTGAAGTWTLRTSAPASTCKGIAWDAAMDRFVWLTDEDVYVSDDGITWTTLATGVATWYHLDTDPQGCLAVRGLCMVAIREAGTSTYQAMVSLDGGETWRSIGNVNKGVAASNIHNRVQVTRSPDNRFVIPIGLAASDMTFAASLRLL